MPKKIMESREELRTAMIDAAERIITEQGVEALTARRLASDLNIAVGTTYNVFRQMDDLIGEVNARTIARITGIITNVDTTGRKSDELLMAYADAYIGFVTANEIANRIFLREVFDVGLTSLHLAVYSQLAVFKFHL